MKVHHIGYCVASIRKASEELKKLGFEGEETVNDRIRKVNILFMKNGNYCIELVEPAGTEEAMEDTPVTELLKKNRGGGTPYHVCYSTPDLEKEIENLRKEKYILAQEPQEAPAIQGKKVAFLYKRAVGLLELVEE